MSKSVLIIFVKNLIPGMVKQRLAKDVGMDMAMEIYKAILEQLAEETDQVKFDKAVFYSQYVELYDMFHDDHYQKHLQSGESLGIKMGNALKWAFEAGYEKAVLIGSDVPNLSHKILEDAFDALDKHDVSVGPAHDGGYYLIGMKTLHPTFFAGKLYSHEDVLRELLQEIKNAKLKHYELPELIDIDTKEDLDAAGIKIEIVPDDEIDEIDDEFRQDDFMDGYDEDFDGGGGSGKDEDYY